MVMMGVLSACSGSGEATTTADQQATSTTTIQVATSSAPAPSTTTPGGPIDLDGDVWRIDSSAFVTFFDIETAHQGTWYNIVIDPASNPDGPYLGVFLRQNTDGEGWNGELGEQAVDCSPGAGGICVIFAPPGERHPFREFAEDGAIDADFDVTGTVDILELDQDGYDIIVDVEFSDGTRLEDLQLAGAEPTSTFVQPDVYPEGDVWRIDPSTFELFYINALTQGLANRGSIRNDGFADRMMIRVLLVPGPPPGTYPLDCEALAGTGLCINFAPPGYTDLNADNGATGTVEVIQFDEDGYDIILNVTFSDGTRIEDLRLTG